MSGGNLGIFIIIIIIFGRPWQKNTFQQIFSVKQNQNLKNKYY